jgi:hypothetical protein
LPEDFTTLEEFWGFWDTHSSADYEEVMEPMRWRSTSSPARCIALWPKTCPA